MRGANRILKVVPAFGSAYNQISNKPTASVVFMLPKKASIPST